MTSFDPSTYSGKERSSGVPSTAKKLEDYPVSVLHVLRQLQDTPYEPVSVKKMFQAVTEAPHFRVPPHVAQRTLVDFYKFTGGQYGVQVESPHEVQSLSILTRKRQRETDLPRSAVAASPAGAVAPQETPPSHGASTDIEASMLQYRLSRIQQNQKESFGPRMCAYYLSREGCRRGAHCPFVHPKQ